MKVFPTLAKDETFSLSELASALELVCSQHAITQADHQIAEVTHAVDDIWAGYCPACSHCVEGRLNNNTAAVADHVTDNSDTESNHSDSLGTATSNSLGTTTSLINNVAPITNVTAATVVAPITPVPHVMAATTQAVSPTFHMSTSVSQCWHNIHIHVIGVPGACFGCYSSLSTAQAAYTQAEKDGSVSRLPL
ncbi:uncharacterized protein BJ212DRAFT_1484251 [Suillus subaureus]|uniref:Uncharacterized protein n=1 Tax=Suillus subaureus TaxID=48587 RepID=A0A9P7E460_9AGAM|nr:uncharacterized protein BJ212DRAFT_1484251 [Suillus subaureus]KAG1810686.1 hypothetical protein BJ212DRAFT_1484251 [Suillus subaureus]